MDKKRLTGIEGSNDDGVEISAVTGWRFAALNLDKVCDPTENSLADEFVKFDFTGSNVGNCFTSGQARGQVRTPRGYQFVAN